MRNAWCLENVDVEAFSFCHLYFYNIIGALWYIVPDFLNGIQTRPLEGLKTLLPMLCTFSIALGWGEGLVWF